MKRTLISIFAIILVSIGCDAPRDRSGAYQSSSPQYIVGYNPASSTTPAVVANSGTTSTTPTTTNSTDTKIPANIAHCKWSNDGVSGFASDSTHLGAYTLCQETGTDNVYLQLKTGVSDTQVCIIPTYNTNGKTIYIGEPSCLYPQESKTIYRIPLKKSRPGFESFAINGVMMMKDKSYYYAYPYQQYLLSVDAFLFCSNWLDQTGDTSYCVAFNSIKEFVVHLFQ